MDNAPTDSLRDLFYKLLERENRAEAQLKEAEEDLAIRLSIASDMYANDETVEEFSRWLPRGRRNIERARQYLMAVALERGLIRQVCIEQNLKDTGSTLSE